MKVIETQPYKGTYVRSISDRELRESSQVRASLEQLGAELAASHFKGNTKALDQEARQFMAAAKRGISQNILCMTWRFID